MCDAECVSKFNTQIAQLTVAANSLAVLLIDSAFMSIGPQYLNHSTAEKSNQLLGSRLFQQVGRVGETFNLLCLA